MNKNIFKKKETMNRFFQKTLDQKLLWFEKLQSKDLKPKNSQFKDF